MEQISLPYRIAFVALLVVGALWFTVLKPKQGGAGGGSAATPTAPGVKGLTNDVTKAKDAVAKANAASGATTSTTTTPAAGGASAPGTAKATKAPKPAAAPGLAADAAAGDPSRPILAQVDAGKVAVVLFWNPKASDDRAARRALRAVDTHHGKVTTTAVNIDDVGKYEAITRGAQILESPTVLVIGAKGAARAISGFTQAGEIDQAVSDIGGKRFR